MPPQLDEGYVEDTRSQSDDDVDADASMLTPGSSKDEYYERLMAAVLGLPIDQRREFVYEVSRTLPVSHIAFNKARLDALLYFDPVTKLPAELFYAVLNELSPRDLMCAGAVSRDWRARATDEKLWKVCFARQGWSLDGQRKSALEEHLNGSRNRSQRTGAMSSAKGKAKADSPSDLERRPSRKRAREEAFSEADTGVSPPASRPRSRAGSTDRMDGVEVLTASRSPGGTVRTHSETVATPPHALQSLRRLSTGSMFDLSFDHSHPHDLLISPQKYIRSGDDHVRLSWPWLYKQRRRLEGNWDKGQYRMFSLPHQEFPFEGHDECVYTIQHSGSHLVSGSRDRTIRIWDLNTCRLKREPLRGHTASVLCLQFDDRTEHDIIVSGGSDSLVLIWRFSTGELIKSMKDAHSESVLNLRFDDRYIVTCSKDHTIKIWNRREIARDSPLIPTFMLNSFDNPSLPDAGEMIKEFTLLATLTGHHAAVNAVQIHEDTIVSASGDRQIKAWDIHTGQPIKTYIGHTKGIACVHFDGRRIVSGSNDTTVRIFDADKACELACLQGHQNLVRTVQARFGDLETVTDEELHDQARLADRSLYKYMAAGGQMASASRRGPRNAGSSRPQDMLSMGAKIPPGGGGSKWARIVSGSYDERVIVWKRDDLGNWVVGLQLHQGHLLGHFSRRNVSRPNHVPLPANYANLNAQAAARPAAIVPPPPDHLRHAQRAQALLEQAQSHLNQVNAFADAALANSSSSQQGLRDMAQRQAELNRRLARMATPGLGSQASLAPEAGSSGAQEQASSDAGANQAISNVSAGTAAPQAVTAPAIQHFQQPQQQLPQPPLAHQQHPLPQPPLAHQQHPLPQPPLAHQQQQHQAQHQAQPGPQPARQGAGSDSSRVFKLQFDARRIICCSQNKIIVGWDFANGDRDLEIVGELSVETP